MVNDNQIDPRDLTHKATEIFFSDKYFEAEPPKLYDLNMEYGKSKGNKNRAVWVVLPLFILITLAGAYFVTRYIEVKSRSVPISIDAFQDVNLREIFDTAKQLENRISKARKELEDLYLERDSEIESITRKAEKEIDIARINRSEDSTEVTFLKNQLTQDLDSTREKWELLIDEKRGEIGKIQDDIDSYDTRIMEKAREQEAIINSQAKRFEIEKEELENYYEEKLNRLVKSNLNEIKTIQEQNSIEKRELIRKYTNDLESMFLLYNPELNIELPESKEVDITGGIYNTPSPILLSEGILDNDSTIKTQYTLYNMSLALSSLQKIPYENLPNKAIDYLENSLNSSINTFYKTLINTRDTLTLKNRLIGNQEMIIDSFNHFVVDYLQNNRINGVVIDERDEALRVLIDPIYKIPNETTGYIYRSSDTPIAVISISGSSARVIKLIDQNIPIKPFDNILLDIK